MARFDTWESYFYPSPDNGTMRNLFNERDPLILSRLEYVETALRQRELNSDPTLVQQHTYDGAHARAIHRYLFQDVYEWAGEYRTVGIAKGHSEFAWPDEIDRYLTDASRVIRSTEWPRLDREAFAERAATVFAYLNQAHPFREGNGRTSKVFMDHVGQRSRFTLDYERVSPGEWNNASALSGPDRGGYEPVPASLVPVFRTIAVERTSPPAPGMDPAAVQRARASYPKPPGPTRRPGVGPHYRQARRGRPGRGDGRYGGPERGIGR